MSVQEFRLNHTLIATLLVCWLVVLIKLGLPELLPYSEAVTAFRADAILHQSATFDQTDFSPSGITSSAKPPLTSQLVALSMYFFGESNFALRLPFALLSLGVLLMVYQLTKHYIPRKFSLFAPVILVGTAFFGYASRTIEPTMPSMLFLLFIVWIVIEIEKKQYNLWVLLSLLSFVFACIVLNDVYAVFIALAIVLPFVLKNSVPRLKILAFIGLGVLIGGSWIVMMVSKYGFPMLQSYIGVGIFPTSFFQKVQNLYLIVLTDAPVVLLGLYVVVQNISQLRQNTSSVKKEEQTLQFSLLFWFFTTLGINLFTPTFASSSAVMLLIPLVLMAVSSIHNLYVAKRKSIPFLTLLLFVLLQSFWNIINYFVEPYYSISQFATYGSIALFLGAIVLSYVLLKVKSQQISFRLVHWIFIVIPVVFVGKQFLTNARISANDLDGATSVGMFFQQGCELPFIYLYHQEHTFSYDSPQLAWYSRTTIPKFIARKTYTPLFLSSSVLDKEAIDALLKPEFYDKPIVYHFLNKAPIQPTLVQELSRYRDILTQKPNYIVFGGVDKMKLLFENKDK